MLFKTIHIVLHSETDVEIIALFLTETGNG